MLKIGKIIMLLAVLLSFGCNKDDTESKEADLIGSWNLISVKSDNYKSAVVANGNTTTSTSTLDGKDISYKYTFNDDKTVSAGGSYTAILKTTVAGEVFTSEIPGISYADSGTWAIDGDKLTIKTTSQAESQTAEIITLTENSLKFKYNFSVSQMQGNFTNTTTGTIFYELEK